MSTAEEISTAVFRQIPVCKGFESVDADQRNRWLGEKLGNLGIKSLQLAALLTEVCNEVGISQFLLSDLDLIKMKSPKDIVTILLSKSSQQATPAA